MKRYYPDFKFPPYTHLPGKTPHPEKEGGHNFDNQEIKAIALDPQNPMANKDYLIGLDLFNHGFYWESHVLWEAVWHKNGRKDEISDFLKGLIKISAAGVKFASEQNVPGKGHLFRAIELLSPIQKSSSIYAGLNLMPLLDQIQQVTDFSEFKSLQLILEDL